MYTHIRSWIPKAVMSEKNSIGGIASPDFKTYYRAITIKKKHGTGTKTDM